MFHHSRGSATVTLTLITWSGSSLMGVQWYQVAGLQLRTNCSPNLLVEELLCFVVPHTTVLMENTAV